MKKKLFTTVILSTAITTAFSSFAYWTAGEYQAEGIDWYYHDATTGALVTNTWTPNGYYVNEVGLWCPYILYENETYDDYLTKATNSILDYYNQTPKWSFDYKTDYIFPSAEAVVAFNQALIFPRGRPTPHPTGTRPPRPPLPQARKHQRASQTPAGESQETGTSGPVFLALTNGCIQRPTRFPV